METVHVWECPEHGIILYTLDPTMLSLSHCCLFYIERHGDWDFDVVVEVATECGKELHYYVLFVVHDGTNVRRRLDGQFELI